MGENVEVTFSGPCCASTNRSSQPTLVLPIYPARLAWFSGNWALEVRNHRCMHGNPCRWYIHHGIWTNLEKMNPDIIKTDSVYSQKKKHALDLMSIAHCERQLSRQPWTINAYGSAGSHPVTSLLSVSFLEFETNRSSLLWKYWYIESSIEINCSISLWHYLHT